MSDTNITKMLLIRHGLTDWNVAQKWQGHADIPLNETGQKQAAALASRLAAWPLEAVISSDLQRCKQTAVAIASQHNLTSQFDPIWRERDVGDFSGFTSLEAREKYPHIWATANAV
jgi:probable phosphoglycerate mutase